jgi:hypothetical protein
MPRFADYRKRPLRLTENTNSNCLKLPMLTPAGFLDTGIIKAKQID